MGGVDFSNGFIKFPRLECWKEWSRDPVSLALFVHLLTRANREPKEWGGIMIQRGQLATSRRHLAETTGIPEQRIRTALDKLTREGLTQYLTHGLTSARRQGATSELTHGFTLVTICNFDDYEGPRPSANPRTNPRGNGEATHELTQYPTTTKEDIKNISAGAPDFYLDLLSSWRDYKRENNETLSPSQLAAALRKIRNYSGDDPDAAALVVDTAISSRWRDIMPIPKELAALAASKAASATPAAPAPRKHLNAEDLENY